MSVLNDDWKWLEEPNKLEFEHAGIKCLILRDRFLWLGGYVGTGTLSCSLGKALPGH